MGIIIITSRDNELDELLCINYGADHYITKPFNIQILLAKISSVLRRTNDSNEIKDKIDAKDFMLNLSNSTIEKNQKNIELTKNELRILKYLVENRGVVVTREALIDKIWDLSGNDVNDNTLTVYIKRIREKLGSDDYLKTIKGIGYRVDKE